MIGVYKITSPSDRSYIGQSVEIEKRHYYHKGLYGRKQPALHNSFKKYGFSNHHFEVLIECDECDLDAYEQYFIDYFNTLAPCGLNLNTGGSNGRPSEQTRIKIGLAGIGRKMSEKNKEKILKALKGKPKSKEHKEKLSLVNRGKKLNSEHREKMSKSHLGIPRDEQTKKNITEGLKRYWENKKAM